MKRSKALLAIFCAMLMAMTTACSGGNSTSSSGAAAPTPKEKVTLKVMHYFTKEEADAGDSTRQVPRDTVLKFGQENADKVDLQITEIQHNDYETKLQALAAANDLPDVFIMKGSWVSNFVNSGLVADITDAVDKCQWKDQYRPNLFDPVTVDGKKYGTPDQFSSTTIAYYNKELWQKAGYSSFPKTWDELLAAVPKFKAIGVDTISLGDKDKWQYGSSWASALGDRYTGTDWTKSIITQDGKAKFTDPEFVKTLELTQKIGQSGALNADYASISNQQAATQFLQGKSATTIDGYWNVAYLIANGTSDMLNKIELAPLPGVSGGKGDQSSITAGCGWFVGVNSKLQGDAKEIATNLALYMTGPVYSQGLSDTGSIGTCKTTASTDAKINAFNKKYLDLVDKASGTTPIYDALMNASVISTMNDQFPQLLAGTVAPTDAAKAIQDEYETSIKK